MGRPPKTELIGPDRPSAITAPRSCLGVIFRPRMADTAVESPAVSTRQARKTPVTVMVSTSPGQDGVPSE
jgi:hypothetical protein